MKRGHAIAAFGPCVALLVCAAALFVARSELTVVVTSSAALAVVVLAVACAALAGGGVLLRARRTIEAARVAADERDAAAESHRRFVSRLDHELKNPLTALLAALAGEDDRSIDRARAQAERIKRLLTDLRRISDVELAPLDRVAIPVEPLLRDAVTLVQEDAGGEPRTVRVNVATAPAAPVADADPDLLLVAIYNVLSNAMKYTTPEDTIEVRARESGGQAPAVVIEIADTGPGIADEDQAIVWEELERGHPPAGVTGSGIGLALTRLIVERHGGRCELTSRVGTGTSVVLHLPGARPGLP